MKWETQATLHHRHCSLPGRQRPVGFSGSAPRPAHRLLPLRDLAEQAIQRPAKRAERQGGPGPEGHLAGLAPSSGPFRCAGRIRRLRRGLVWSRIRRRLLWGRPGRRALQSSPVGRSRAPKPRVLDCPCAPACVQAGCQSSIRLPSGSATQPKRPTPSMSCVSSATSAPLARSCASIASRSRTRKLSIVCWVREPK